jgi:hypothetical protein
MLVVMGAVFGFDMVGSCVVAEVAEASLMVTSYPMP